MRPALTPEEWRKRDAHPYHAVLVDFGRCGCGQARIVNLYDPSVEPKQGHKLAALALDGQPFGFTREDLTTLREAVAYDPTVGWLSERLESLATRIEALLPPEPK